MSWRRLRDPVTGARFIENDSLCVSIGRIGDDLSVTLARYDDFRIPLTELAWLLHPEE